jgi:malate dehydrogenase (oxaloacetate-decarboxylating)
VQQVLDRTFELHLGGKIEVKSTVPLKTRDELSMAYTPGVARVCSAIHDDAERAWALTIKGNTVAVISDGTAVLGLGDIGPEAAMPVMEGKALLLKEFAGVDAFPLCIATKDVDEIVAFVKAAAPTFGGINLEDIAAPRCFEIERRLRAELDIPVFHDDQHGTAIVVLAALLNALRVVGKRVGDARIVVTGAGAAGMACTNIILAEGATNIIVCDIEGALYSGRPGLDPERAALAERTNPAREQGMADELLAGADVYLGLSAPGAVSAAAVRTMGSGAIVFAMANPTPEVQPEDVSDHVRIMATGALGLSEPDQQRARVPGCVPRCAGRPREHDQRGDEAGRGPGDRLGRLERRTRSRVHHPERVQSRRGVCGRDGGRGRRAGEWRRPPSSPPRVGVTFAAAG